MNVDVVRFPTADVKLSRPRFDDISGSDVTALRLWPAAVPHSTRMHSASPLSAAHSSGGQLAGSCALGTAAPPGSANSSTEENLG